MERKLQERMVGAGVLIMALVIVGPMLLDGRSGSDITEEAIPGQRSEELRTHTFRLNEPRAEADTSPRPARPHPAAPAISPASVSQPQREPARDTSGAPPPAAAGNAPSDPAPRSETRVSPAQLPSPAPTVAAGAWLVQVGTFGQKDNAERLVASLKQRGFPAFLSPTARGDKTLYRVRVGPPGSREAAAGVASRLAAAGQTGQLVAQ